MNRLLNTLAAAAAVLALNTAHAHGPGEAKHGGIVQSANDLGFELVAKDGNATLYVEDHGKPFAVQGTTGKLTVLNGSDKSEAELTPAGDNKLEAKGVKLNAGAKVVAALTLPSKKVVTVRFTVK
ncbi:MULTISPECIES: hypothetical protein [unclassified Tepidimonas]|uniref:hypothetical protein n=1 Tax=unclassified Tepidimonas TaxID=2631705 RepID=UPI003C7D2518